MNILYVRIILSLLLVSTIHSQVTQEWVARYNSSGSRIDIVSEMVIDAAGNVYVTGFTYSESYAGDEDFLTVKYNSLGVEQWVQTYNGTIDSVDKAWAIAIDNLNNVYVTGSSMGDQYGNFNWVTIKYNSIGIEQWVHRYAPLGGGEPSSIVAHESGYIYVAGQANDGFGIHFTTIKYNSALVPLWITSELAYDGKNITAMKVDYAGNVYVTGLGYLGSVNCTNYVTIKYNSSGVKQWWSFYNGFDLCNEPKSIALDELGNVYVTGSSEGSANNNDFLTVKYNSSGIQEWTARYAGPDGYEDDAYSVAVDNSGNVYVTGRSFGIVTDYDYATLKYNSSGVQQWLQRFNGSDDYPGDDIPHALVLDGEGSAYITGSYSNGGGYATIKYNTAGDQQWLQKYRGPGDNTDIAISVKVSDIGNVFVSGISTGAGTMQDFATLKYSQAPNDVYQTASVPLEDYSLLQNYPNPFNPSTVISYRLPEMSLVSLKVYDVLGREIATLVNEEQLPGDYKVTFSASGGASSGIAYPASGIYFYQLRAGSFSEGKKMILIK